MCIDNPREGFADLFSTHPSVESRVKALVDVAGGHDPGPLALPAPGEPQADALPDPAHAGAPQAEPWGSAADPPATHDGPWGPAPQQASPEPGRPFLPDRPPIAPGGPWGKPGG
jgi:heat shock protein HtpX